MGSELLVIKPAVPFADDISPGFISCLQAVIRILYGGALFGIQPKIIYNVKIHIRIGFGFLAGDTAGVIINEITEAALLYDGLYFFHRAVGGDGYAS